MYIRVYSCIFVYDLFILTTLLKSELKSDIKIVSRLFAELVVANEIVQTEDSVPNNVKYRILK